MSLSGTYSVAAYGTVSVSGGAGLSVTVMGYFSADGNTQVLQDLRSGDDSEMVLLIR